MDEGKLGTTRRGAFGLIAATSMAPAAVAAQAAGPVVSAAERGLTGRYSEDATRKLQELFDSATTDLLRFEPEGELRGGSITGLRLAFNGPGRDALSFAGGERGVIGNVVERCAIDGGNAGHAIRLAGHGNHFNVVRDCIEA